MVNWPSILKLDGDEELIYLADQDAFLADCAEMIMQREDRLIDSEGYTFSIESNNNSIVLCPCNAQLDAKQVSTLIQEHEFANAQACIIKIHFASVAQAIQALAH
ncbi:DUF4144 domain-containing protein [Vibrio japonicus]|uniref:DUF4144 domain-containing protein n=1 Tax=Vibrio japonicus TaxID=1824638 RepID=A0ABY5LLB2_9VIBR|nr:DUF4144 domain-containing protein [Vibrio japonicus]UUM32904.1 DUF4144 domain-containing protein [Vibrio japonicus]